MRGRKVRKTLVPMLAACLALGLVIGGVELKNRGEEERETVQVFGRPLEMTVDDLFSQSSLVAEGTVSGQSDAFQVRGVEGGVRNFTDYYFDIDKTYRGATHEQTVSVRIEGGTVGDYTETYDPSPELREGEKYLLFLYQPEPGGAYNTDGEYYYILGLPQGVFQKNEDGTYTSQYGETIDLQEQKKRP